MVHHAGVPQTFFGLGGPDAALSVWVAEQQEDSRNLLSTISLDGTNIDSRSYDTGGRLSSETLGNGLVVTRTYMTGDNLPLAISSSAVGTYTYAWDANKNKTGETITGAMSAYTSSMGFDDQNRLISWNRSNGNSQAWTLSAVNDWQSFTNNGTAVARTHGPTHEILTVGSATITHDSRGNMTSDEFAITRTYDVDNKVNQAVVPSGSTRGIVGTHSYQYDVMGRRVRKTVGGTSQSDTVFALAGEQIVADYPAGTAAGSPTMKYLWGSYIDELVCQAAGAGRLYPHRNQQYSTVALSDQSAALVERYTYTSYGDLLTLDPAGTTVRTTPPQTRYTYTAREYDHETGTFHFRARPYSATLGRFTGHDPIRYPDGANTYAGWFAATRKDSTGMAGLGTKLCGAYGGRVLGGCTGIGIYTNCTTSDFGTFIDENGELLKASSNIREKFLTKYLPEKANCDGNARTLPIGPVNVFDHIDQEPVDGSSVGGKLISTPHQVSVSGSVTVSCSCCQSGGECKSTVKVIHADLYWTFIDEIDANPTLGTRTVGDYLWYCMEGMGNVIGDGLLDAEYNIRVESHEVGGNGKSYPSYKKGPCPPGCCSSCY